MPQCSSRALAENLPETSDFNGNYNYLKKLIQDLRVENSDSLKKELFGDTEPVKPFSKKDMKQLFKFLRKIEHHYEELSTPPIPSELEKSIRSRAKKDWLPWELEAIQKIEVWREEFEAKKDKARNLLESTLEKVRRGEKLG
ncbi:MAG: hypothetical protein M0T73_04295 [Deltaproteobacteria bacterium]|nr:hypothetical protein [Deltaproteobacteria bacterium]